MGVASASKISPEEKAKQPKFSTLQPLNCFYLESVEDEHGSTPLVLNCDDGGCGLEEHVYDDKDQMFWWDANSNQEWGKIVLFNKDWDKTKPQYLAFGKDHKMKLVEDKKEAPDFFYEMRDSTLMSRNNVGIIERVAATQQKKWADVVVNPLRDSLEELDPNAVWHIEYCYWENKPNPENANEKIPQSTMIKHFPDNWHATGEFDYEESKYNTFLYPDPRCPAGHLVEYKDDESGLNQYTLYPDMEWCHFKPNAVSDGERGDVLHVDHWHDWCWFAYGWDFKPNVWLDDAFRLHVWVKWTGVNQPWGGIWARMKWSDQEWYDCPRGEWCELDVSVEGIDWDRWGGRHYYET